MPDNRTIYSSDDGSNGVLLKFVADRPAELSSGGKHLPAACYCGSDGDTMIVS
jgi:hypothetical protein